MGEGTLLEGILRVSGKWESHDFHLLFGMTVFLIYEDITHARKGEKEKFERVKLPPMTLVDSTLENLVCVQYILSY